jgi:hypothetical protein
MFKNFINRIKPQKKVKIKAKTLMLMHKDLIRYLKANRKYFIGFESKRISKSKEEAGREFDLGYKLLDLDLSENFFSKRPIIIIPPKYELWPHLFLALKLVRLGYEVDFLYFRWARKIIKLLVPRTEYLDYQNLKFYDVEEYDRTKVARAQVFNMSDTVKGIPSNVPSYSTAYVSKRADLDYAAAFITEHAFNFAGLKKSSIKRVLLEEGIEKAFVEKVAGRLRLGREFNLSFIKSEKTMEGIRELISEAISDGADVHWGDAIFSSTELPRNIFLSDVKPEMRIFQKRFYGPVLETLNIADTEMPLDKLFKMQPSTGIVVFCKNKDCEVIDILPEGFEYAFRSAETRAVKLELLNDHPTLEFLLEGVTKNN